MNPSKLLLKATVVASLTVFVGCQNPYAQFYRDYASIDGDLASYSGHTKIYTSGNYQRDGEDLARQGYTQIGESGFEAGSVSESRLRAHGKAVGADIILCSTAFAGSVESAVPLLQYEPGQVSTTQYSGNAQASAYGSGGGYARGTASYSGQSTTTTPGKFTTSVVPITVSRYTYFATYWRKTRSGQGSVAGVVAESVETGMPGIAWEARDEGIVVLKIVSKEAAASGLLAGDIIVAIGEKGTQGKNFVEGMKFLVGPLDKPLIVSVRRGDRIIHLAVPRQKNEAKPSS